MRRHFLKLAVALAVSGALSTSALAADPAKPELVFGTTVGDFGDMVKLSIKPILEKQGYKVKLVEFTDYVRPNLALAEGSIDVNIFQHKPHLDNFAKEHKLALTPVAQSADQPAGPVQQASKGAGGGEGRQHGGGAQRSDQSGARAGDAGRPGLDHPQTGH